MPKSLPNSPDWREYPPVFYGRYGRKAGVWNAENVQAIRFK